MPNDTLNLRIVEQSYWIGKPIWLTSHAQLVSNAHNADHTKSSTRLISMILDPFGGDKLSVTGADIQSTALCEGRK